MHIYTHLINFPKIESNARFFELVQKSIALRKDGDYLSNMKHQTNGTGRADARDNMIPYRAAMVGIFRELRKARKSMPVFHLELSIMQSDGREKLVDTQQSFRAFR